MKCFFCTDLHGNILRYEKLLRIIETELPDVVLLGGDLLGGGSYFRKIMQGVSRHFTVDYFREKLTDIKSKLSDKFPEVLIIPGNDDPAAEFRNFSHLESVQLLTNIHNRRISLMDWDFYGYACIPPSPFQLKDWERYDVSRFTDPGCTPPNAGFRTVETDERKIEYSTIQDELKTLTGKNDLSRSVFLFHVPPYQTALDRAALDGKSIDYAPLDVHIGSVAVKRFIENRQPLLTLHGHVHESTRLTGEWKVNIGKTICLQGATEASEFVLLEFNLLTPEKASRRSLKLAED